MNQGNSIGAMGVLAAAGLACAQNCSWERVTAAGPEARARTGLVYDSLRSRSVLFGGNNAAGEVLGDTWLFNGASWNAVATPVAPSARAGHAMAFFDSGAGTLLFGGEDSGAPLGDTWLWDGSAWSLVTPTGPSARSGAAMAFFSGRGRVVLFGGFAGAAFYPSTFEWNGSTWSERTAPVSPGSRAWHAMAYAPTFGRVVLHGGVGPTSAALSDTWGWDGTDWIQMAPGPARLGHRMVFDIVTSRLVMQGGFDAGGAPVGDTWEYINSAWALRPDIGPASGDGGMSYDIARTRIVRFGGSAAVGPTDWTDERVCSAAPPSCYANCDGSSTAPLLNIADYVCFMTSYAAGFSSANCDHSTRPPVLNVLDFVCFMNSYAEGCT